MSHLENGDDPDARFVLFFAIGTPAARKQALLLCEGWRSFHCVVTFKCYFPANSFSVLSLLFLMLFSNVKHIEFIY